jgi:hypothetical protein
VGGAGLLLCLLGAWLDPRQAAFSYLAAFACWLAVALGALLMVMIAHSTGANWFLPMRRLAECAAATLPLFALLFVPLLLAAGELYPWARPVRTLSGPVREAVLAKRGYFALPFFAGRAAAYFAVWIAVALLLLAWSVRSDARPGPGLVRRQRVLAAVGLPPVGFAMTFAAFDWLMSLAPEWTSTLFGIYYFAGGMTAALGLLAVLAYALGRGELAGELAPAHFHALGKLLLTFVIFWGYIAYAQFFIIWIADIPGEAGWYLPRVSGGWRWVAAAVALAQFAIPFFALLSWRLKRVPAALAAVGAWLVVAHCLDVGWLVLPALHPEGPSLHWLDLAAFLGVGGAALAFGSRRFGAHAPAPVGDPSWPAALEFTTR